MLHKISLVLSCEQNEGVNRSMIMFDLYSDPNADFSHEIVACFFILYVLLTPFICLCAAICVRNYCFKENPLSANRVEAI